MNYLLIKARHHCWHIILVCLALTAPAVAWQNLAAEEKGESPPINSQPKKGEETPAKTPPSKKEDLKDADLAAQTPEEPKVEEVVASSIEKPSGSLFTGAVVILNPKKKFVIVDFRQGEVPPVKSELGVYRNGIFVGSVRITKPVKPPLASADILTGTLRKGDIVQ